MPLLWLSVFFLAGIFLGSRVPFSSIGWAGLAAAGLSLAIAEQTIPKLLPWRSRWRRLAPLPAGLLMVSLFLGAARYQVSRPILQPTDLAYYTNREVRISAVVVEPPRRLDSQVQLRLQSREMIEVDGAVLEQPVAGLLLANLPLGSDYRYGDRLELAGRLAAPPEDEFFSYREYLARQRVYAVISYPRVKLLSHDSGNLLYRGIYALRSRAEDAVNRLFPQPEAALLSGILLGLDDGIPSKLEDAFRDTGTAHIIAISGFNIAILAGLFSTISGRLLRSRWLSLLAAILGVVFYTLLVGAGASVARAAVMGCLALLGVQIGRRQAGSNALAFTAAVMTAFNPDILWDVSFQLSFCATLGLVWFGEPLENAANQWVEAHLTLAAARRVAGPLNDYFLLTLAAQTTTLPVILYHFQRVSISSLLANPLVLPPQPLVMILGGLSTLAGMVFLPLGKLFSFLVWPFLTYTIRVTEALASLPNSAVSLGEVNALGLVFSYLVLFLLSRNLSWLWNRRILLKPMMGMALLGLGSLAAWRGFYEAPDGLLHLMVLADAPGPSIQIQTPNGRYFMIMGQAPTRALKSAVSSHLPLYSRQLDGVLLPGHKSSALEGIPDFLESFSPDWILWNEGLTESRSASYLRNWTLENSVSLLSLENGQSVDLGGGARMEVLDLKDEETLLGISWGDFRAVFVTNGTPAELAGVSPPWFSSGIFLVLLDADLSVSPPTGWLDLQPSAVVAASGSTGLPSNWLALDRTGGVEFSTDGHRVWLTTEK